MHNRVLKAWEIRMDTLSDEEQLDIKYGLITACDECQMPGNNAIGYPDWQLQPDGRVLCKMCAEAL